jgi:hypothetical protein
MGRKRSMTRGETLDADGPASRRFSRVVAVIVALENYRKPFNGEALPSVEFAHADADGMHDAVREIFKDMPTDDVFIEVMKDDNASLTAVKDHLSWTIRNLAEDDLFILYYAGHGFHGGGGNRLSTYDTNRINIGDTSLSMRDDLLEPLSESACSQALIFVDACAEKFRDVVQSRDVISNLEVKEVEEFLDSGWYLGVFLSCSPGEKSYPSTKLGHGIWTHFLLEALGGRAEGALTRERWLTGDGLQNYLRQEVPRFITQEMSIRGTQTPQAILSASNTFRVHYVPRPPAVPADAALAGIRLRNHSEYLEGTETGAIRQLDGFQRGYHTVPKSLTDSANSWCNRLLADRVAEELQALYQHARTALGVRRKDLRKEDETGAGDLDTPAFRYIIETGQNPDDPAEYYIKRRLELRQGWPTHRAAIDELFGDEFQRLVIEFESMDDTFDDLVDRLEDVSEKHGGEVDDDDRHQRVSYHRDGVIFTFDLKKKRLEISFGQDGTLQLVDAAQRFQLGIGTSSPMLAAPASGASSPKRLR